MVSVWSQHSFGEQRLSLSVSPPEAYSVGPLHTDFTTPFSLPEPPTTVSTRSFSSLLSFLSSTGMLQFLLTTVVRLRTAAAFVRRRPHHYVRRSPFLLGPSLGFRKSSCLSSSSQSSCILPATSHRAAACQDLGRFLAQDGATAVSPPAHV